MKSLALFGAVALVASSASAASVVEWRVSDGGNGHFYDVVRSQSRLTWEDARPQAVELGGHLTTLTSAAEDQLNSLLAEKFDTPDMQGGWKDVEPMDTTDIDGQIKKAIWVRRTSEMDIVSLPVKPYIWIAGQMGDTAEFVTPPMGKPYIGQKQGGGPSGRIVKDNRLMDKDNLPKTVAGKPFYASQVIIPETSEQPALGTWAVPGGNATYTLTNLLMPRGLTPVPIIIKGKTKGEILDQTSDVGEDDPLHPGEKRMFEFLHQEWPSGGPTLRSFGITAGITTGPTGRTGSTNLR
ncbi:MAG: hypothetical protein FJ167_03640 [Gammaproteobacteria bacterium]|nr:hypothetical protein [Gammaproteobacteria bacterium]